MKKPLAFLFFLLHSSFFTLLCEAQNIAINNTGAPANPSAMLDVNSSTGGLLPPRMTTAQMNAIANPATGLMVFNTTTNCYMGYGGSAWQNIACLCSGAPTITGTTPGSRTGNGTVTLGATASAGTINWWAAATGGSSLATGTSFTTPALCTSSTTYYVDATANGCTTASRTSVTATVSKTFEDDPSCSLTTNLISYWPMQGNSNDFFGSNNGTDNAMSYSNSCGKVNEGACFNGSSSKILVPSSSTLAITNSLTLAAWVNFSTVAPTYQVLVSGDNNSSNAYYQITTYGSKARSWSVNTSPQAIVGNTTLSAGTWYFIVIVWNAGTITIYVNGSQDATQTYSGSVNSPATPDVNMGNDYSGAYPLSGSLDEVGVWSRALTPAEITALYNGGAGQTMH